MNAVKIIAFLTFLFLFQPCRRLAAQEKSEAMPPPESTYKLRPQLMPLGARPKPQMPDPAPKFFETSCPNSDFSNGDWTNWTGAYGFFSTPGIFTGYSSTGSNILHQIIPAPGWQDPFTCYGLNNVFPGENFVTRLGDTLYIPPTNSTIPKEGEMRYAINVTPDSYLFIYRYAIVLQTGGHSDVEQPDFKVQITDAAGVELDPTCGSYHIAAQYGGAPIPGWHLCTGVYPMDVYWKDWTTVGMDLTAYSGQTVYINFKARGCYYDTHFGYAYISAYCNPMAIQLSFCPDSTTATLTAPPGFATYAWRGPGFSGPSIGSTQSIVINNPMPNDFYYVNLTAINGCTVNDISQQIVYTAINPAFTFYTQCAGGFSWFFDATTINQNGIINWRWNFGDGSPVLEGMKNPAHAYPGAGSYNVTLTAFSSEGCRDSIIQTIVVPAIPVPTLAGNALTCVNSPDQVYTTEAGQSNYIWTIPPGALLISGGTATDNTATIRWTTNGTFNIGVNYSAPGSWCSGENPASLTVTVGQQSAPEISGVSPVCEGVAGSTYTTAPGKTNYIWTYPPQATRTAGGTTADNFITLTWTSSGTYNVSVIYTDPVTSCVFNAPAVYPVTVNPQPMPTITGPSTVCLNLAVTYSTEDLKTGYVWNVVSGGSILSGQATNQVSVVWNTTGTHTITVIYADPLGCTTATPASVQVVVNAMPAPTLTGAGSVCTGDSKTYLTEAGAASYAWALPSSGFTLVSGGGIHDDQITLTWNTAGVYNISVNYTSPSGCMPSAPATYPVTVNATPVPQILGPSPVCSSTTNSYTVSPVVTGHLYNWTINGGTIQSGQNTAAIMILWGNSFPGSVDLTETAGFQGVSCQASANTFPVAIDSWPVAAGTITGQASVCRTASYTYSIPSILNATSYQWFYSGSGVNVTGNGSTSISIAFSSTATGGNLTVNGVNNCGSGAVSSPLVIVVHNPPEVAFTPCFDLITTPGAKKIGLRGGSPWVPGQGVYSGTRVSLNALTGMYEFDPSGASPGAYSITYSFTNTSGCMASPPAVSINVQTNPFTCGADLTDVRDGKKYKTALLTGHCWMSENLAFGTTLSSPGTPQIDNCIPEKYCTPAIPGCTRFGGMYQWDELMDYASVPGTRGICPPEWHVPTEAEWQYLIDNLVAAFGPPAANGTSGAPMKDLLLAVGFHGLLGGLNYNDSFWAFTSGTNTGTQFWTSTASGPSQAVARGLNSYNQSISQYLGSRGNAFSLRCIKDL